MANLHGAQVLVPGFFSQVVLVNVTGLACFFFLNEPHDLEDFVGLAPEVMATRNGTRS